MPCQLCAYHKLIDQAHSSIVFVLRYLLPYLLPWQTIAKNLASTHHPHARVPVENESMESERKGDRVIQLRKGREESERKIGR